MLAAVKQVWSGDFTPILNIAEIRPASLTLMNSHISSIIYVVNTLSRCSSTEV